MGSTFSSCRCLEIDRLADYATEFRPGRKEDSHPGEQLDQRAGDNASDSSRVIYEGEYKNGKRHGFGVLIRPCGSRFEGYFVDDAANGPGKFIHPSGDVYEGQWKDNQAHGTGTFTHSDGSSYEGQWVSDVQEGIGRERWMDGSSYEGNYKAGLKSGTGKFTWPDGSSYEGQFFQNDIHGEGTYVWTDGKSYSGKSTAPEKANEGARALETDAAARASRAAKNHVRQWFRNHMHGKGRMTFPDGRMHEGDYADDRKHGKGRLTWPDGRSFEGEWREGRQVPGVGVYRDGAGREIPNPAARPSGPGSHTNPGGSLTQGSPDVLSDSSKAGSSRVKGEAEERGRKKSLFSISHNHQRRRSAEASGSSTGGAWMRRRSDSRASCLSPRQGERGAVCEESGSSSERGPGTSSVDLRAGPSRKLEVSPESQARAASGKKRRDFSHVFRFGRKKAGSG
ncbi:putative MORN repeat-containing protein [Neospora caninum Liverpool]|uniref:MORN repeat-containing protein, putative n=1 Tax=Neospora caninum (strain Liverpool) TaxID=572307 RepID=F0V8V9_NEOCL|nr:putative MORN repeat-containing protein [Neospora caninum Liverpool]CBZ50150.1 putative MORN repeat-containing protein [Neospora caninum Liverpool]CEL64745.1 TPA: MORN repeat-containing protein, putative [Neospora caninum Liverpool]|eukprot:XP_003880185.1 putative MORN repeat-containing protein [Neospora caninum Liverpool]